VQQRGALAKHKTTTSHKRMHFQVALKQTDSSEFQTIRQAKPEEEVSKMLC